MTSSASTRSPACDRSQSANRSCNSALTAFGRASYAASRISRWRNRNPSSPGNWERSGRTSSLRTSAASRGVTSLLFRLQGLHGAAVEDLALDRRARARGAPRARAGRSWRRATPGRSAAPRSRRRSRDRASRPSPRRRADFRRRREESAPRRLASICRPASRLSIRSSHASSRSGSSRSVTGQPGRPVEQFRPRAAQQQNRRSAGEQVRHARPGRERSPLPTGCRRRRRRAEQPPRPASGRPRRSPHRVVRTSSPRSERIASAACASDLDIVELLDDFDDRPVGDPLAVGQAAAADDARAGLGDQLGSEPRLAGPWRVRAP